MTAEERVTWCLALALILGAGWLFEWMKSILGPAEGIEWVPLSMGIIWIIAWILRRVYLAGRYSR